MEFTRRITPWSPFHLPPHGCPPGVWTLQSRKRKSNQVLSSDDINYETETNDKTEAEVGENIISERPQFSQDLFGEQKKARTKIIKNKEQLKVLRANFDIS